MTEQGTAKRWLDAIRNAEKVFDRYNDSADKVEKQYADLERLAQGKDDAFNIFWANMEIMRPSVYQRPPQPVVMPRHTDTGEIPRKGAELMERALEYDVEADDLHQTLLQVRDDLCLVGRGVPWVLDNGSAIHVDRHDFLHEPGRKWQEVTWVARAVYLTQDEWPEEFSVSWAKVQTEKPGKDRADDYGGVDEKAKVWEIWSKTDRMVYHVCDGVDDVLQEQEAFIDVKGFFPCPKPAYSTLEPHTLKPVPDLHFYVGQVDEIRVLTGRIKALSDSLRMKGFYAAGQSEVGEAIEAAMAQTTDKAILVPVSSAAAMGGQALRDSIVWLPVAEIAGVIQSCIELRKQLIEDVYEITGLSDIMRGVTQAQETLGAQNLKAQYGSVRVREKQAEMVRIAHDVLSIKAEIMAETFEPEELLAMSGMQLPTMEQAQQIAMQAQAQGQQPPPMVTVEQVFGLLREQRLRPFLLEVETDSTIAPNEAAEKEQRVEFLGAVGQFIGQALPAVQQNPSMAPFMGELMRFGVGAFRAGRDLGGEIDQFVEQMKAQAAQPQDQQPDPEAIKAQAEAQKMQMEAQAKQMDAQIKQAELQLRQQEMGMKQAEAQAGLEMKRYTADLQAALKAQDQRIKMQELGIKQDEQRMKEAQQEIDAMMSAAEIELEATQERPVGIGD